MKTAACGSIFKASCSVASKWLNSWLALLHLAQSTSCWILLYIERDIDAAVWCSLCSFYILKITQWIHFIEDFKLTWPLPCPYAFISARTVLVTQCQMSKIVSQRGNEFLQPARVDDSPGMVGLHRCSSRILVPQLCKGQLLNIFPIGLFFGATAGLGCGQDRKQGAFISTEKCVWSDICSTTQLLTCWLFCSCWQDYSGGVGMGPNCFQSLVQVKAC